MYNLELTAFDVRRKVNATDRSDLPCASNSNSFLSSPSVQGKPLFLVMIRYVH
jgi:hypothetical protein